MIFLKVSRAFSFFEILLCLLIISILSLFVLKPQIQEVVALRQASLHIQMLQKQINQIAYEDFLQKRVFDENRVLSLIHNAQTQNNFFSFVLQRQNFVLQIGTKRLQMQIKQSDNNHYVITCNPSQLLCRKLYHRKHFK